MKEVAKMLKSLGPHYSLKWEWFFDYDPVIRMELTYFNPMTQMIFKCDQKFPQEALNNTGDSAAAHTRYQAVVLLLS